MMLFLHKASSESQSYFTCSLCCSMSRAMHYKSSLDSIDLIESIGKHGWCSLESARLSPM